MREGVLGPFVPALLTARVAGRDPGPVGPDGWRTSAAVLVIDITGFTALTERLATRGPGGAETLAAALNASFGDVIDRILDHGGDVTSFAGDAILAVWPDGCPRCIRLAATAALAAQADLEARPPTEDIRIRARAGIAVGDLWVGVVGGVGDEWRWVVGGEPLGVAAAGAARGEPGQLIATAAVVDGGALAATPLDGDGGYARVESVPAERPVAPATDGAADLDGLDNRLAAFLPPEVVARLERGGTGWLAEFRRVTVVFVGIGGLDAGLAGALQLAQPAFGAIQQVVGRYEGSVVQIVDDDKGLTVLAGWGLPDRAHEDDAARGVLAAAAIQEALAGFGLDARIGVTTGVGFTGIRGSPARCEYAMVGDVVNLAARLMASSRDEIRVDAATARAAARRLPAAGIALADLGSLEMKGKAAGVPAYRAERAEPTPDAPAAPMAAMGPAVPAKAAGAMIGRETEWSRVLRRLDRLRDGAGGVLVIEGEPGVGKSELVRALVGATAPPARSHVGEADAIERSTPYFVWRRPVAELLDADPGDGRALERALAERLAGSPSLLDRAPLLAAILPIELPVPDALERFEADVRADAIRDLVVELASLAASRSPRAVILEDVHWADSSSWALMLAVARRVPDVLLVLSTRPMGGDAPVELDRLLAEPGADRILLGPLPIEATDALVCRALGVAALPEGVAAFIGRRAEGNPFFSEQLAFALRDAGHLVVDGDRARLARGVRDLADLDLPDSIHGVLAGRIDRLSATEQLTLKVASVIGRLFRVRILEDVHPIGLPRPELATALDRASGLELTRLDAPDPDLAYLFTHVITQEVAYDLLVFAQRRPLHRAVAEWYEAHVADLEPLVPLLAHHWSRAGVTEKALHYLGRAGEQALQNYANAEALRFLGEAIALDDADGGVTSADVRADWERWTAIALVKSARYREALPHFEAALTLMGAPNPGGRIRRVLSIQRHFVLQGWRRLHRSRVPDAARDRALKISECHRYLSEVSYWRNDLPRMVHAMLASLNHAEPAGDSKEMVFGFASVGFLFGLVQMHGIARRYRRMTDEASARVGNPDAAGYAAELSGVYHHVVADYDGARAVARSGMDIFREIGDSMRWHTCHAIVGLADLHQGRFEAATANMREALTKLGPDGLLQNRVWSLSALIDAELAQDRLDLALADELEDLLGPAVHHHDEIMARGVIAKARARAGDDAGARRNALVVPPMLDAFPPPSYHAMIGILGAIDVLIDRWAADPANATARRDARHGLRGLGRFARFNHAARPRAATARGRAQRIDGSVDAARRSWERARTMARKLDVPYEHGLADVELAASYPAGSPERAAAVACALEDFDAGGATYDAGRALALLGTPREAAPGAPPATSAAPSPASGVPALSDEPVGAAAE